MRYAIALLLYQPGLAAEIAEPSTLASIPEPGVLLLMEMLEIARNSPHMNGAGMLERFRGTEHEAALSRLSTWKPEIPDEGLGAEMLETIRRLRERNAPQRRLLNRLARGEALSEGELSALRQTGGNGRQTDEDN